MAKKIVYSVTKIVGFHVWPDAPLGTLRFLSDRHRHEFHIKAAVMVTDGNRQVEFFSLGQNVRDCIDSLYSSTVLGVEFMDDSCEIIAEKIATALDLYSCEVSEDGEDGAIWTRLG